MTARKSQTLAALVMLALVLWVLSAQAQTVTATLTIRIPDVLVLKIDNQAANSVAVSAAVNGISGGLALTPGGHRLQVISNSQQPWELQAHATDLRAGSRLISAEQVQLQVGSSSWLPLSHQATTVYRSSTSHRQTTLDVHYQLQLTGQEPSTLYTGTIIYSLVRP